MLTSFLKCYQVLSCFILEFHYDFVGSNESYYYQFLNITFCKFDPYQNSPGISLAALRAWTEQIKTKIGLHYLILFFPSENPLSRFDPIHYPKFEMFDQLGPGVDP